MTVIELDAATWTSAIDFYATFLKALGAPEGHGTSVNALVDSVVYGNMNAIDPPFTVRIRGWAHAPTDAVQEIEWAMEDIGKGSGVTWELIP